MFRILFFPCVHVTSFNLNVRWFPLIQETFETYDRIKLILNCLLSLTYLLHDSYMAFGENCFAFKTYVSSYVIMSIPAYDRKVLSVIVSGLHPSSCCFIVKKSKIITLMTIAITYNACEIQYDKTMICF